MTKNSLITLTMTLLLGYHAQANDLTLTPPPVVEGVNNTEVTLNVKELQIKEAKSFEQYLANGNEDTKVYLLELSSDTPYWLDYMSSMGSNSRKELMVWVKETLLSKYKEKEEMGEIVEENSMLASFFGGATKENLMVGVNSMATLIAKLLEPYENKATIDRSFYATSLKICPFSQRFFSFVIVDPKPFSGPDNKTYLIIIESVYEE